MATAETSGDDVVSEAVGTARDFIVDRLQDAESALSPSDLADEYGCSNGHCRNVLADLLDEGVVERVGHGEYLATSDDGEGEDSEVVAQDEGVSEGNPQEESAPADVEIEPEEKAEAVVGEALSEDLDTEEDSREEVDGVGGEPAVSPGQMVLFGTLVLVVVWLVLGLDGQDEQPSESEVDTEESGESDEGPAPEVWGDE